MCEDKVRTTHTHTQICVLVVTWTALLIKRMLTFQREAAHLSRAFNFLSVPQQTRHSLLSSEGDVGFPESNCHFCFLCRRLGAALPSPPVRASSVHCASQQGWSLSSNKPLSHRLIPAGDKSPPGSGRTNCLHD